MTLHERALPKGSLDGDNKKTFYTLPLHRPRKPYSYFDTNDNRVQHVG